MNTHKNSFIPFKEVQKFPRSWIASGFLLIVIVSFWLFSVNSLWKNLMLWDETAWIMLGFWSGFPTVIFLPMTISLLYGKMTTEVNQDGLYIHHFPFGLPLLSLSRKKISLDGLIRTEITTYKTNRWSGYPITSVADGERFTGNVYDTNQYTYSLKCSGMGVKLKFSEPESTFFRKLFTPSQDVLIESQRPKELARAIQQLAPKCKIVESGL